MDFVKAYPQLFISYDLYMELPKGFKTRDRDDRNHILQLLKNLYEQKQASRVWNHQLNYELRKVGFKQLAVN